MRKFVCRCGSAHFSVDECNAGRITCEKCGKKYFWNGKEFEQTMKLREIIWLVKYLVGIEQPPKKLEPKEFEEIELPAARILVEKEKITHKIKPKKLPISLPILPEKKGKYWCKAWNVFILEVIEKGVVQVNDYEHVGSIRGKHIVKEAHRKFNLLGLKSAIDFGKGTISFLDDKEKAYRALQEIQVR